MSFAHVTQIPSIPMLPGRRAVLTVLADMANGAGVCWPSITTIAHRACVSVRSVFTHLAELAKAGLVHRRQRIGRASVFTVTLGAVHAPTDTPDNAPDQATSAPAPELTPTPQPAQQSAPAPAIAPVVLTVETVVQAMRRAGLVGAYDTPSLSALVADTAPAAGLTEFTSVATEAVSKGKGFAWALAAIKGRRADRAALVATVPGMVGRDPVLTQIEADAAKATAPPAGIRERLAQLRAAITGGVVT